MASSRYVPALIGRHRHPKSNLGKVAGERKGGQSGEDLKIRGVNTYPLVMDSREPDWRSMAATPRINLKTNCANSSTTTTVMIGTTPSLSDRGLSVAYYLGLAPIDRIIPASWSFALPARSDHRPSQPRIAEPAYRRSQALPSPCR